MSAGGGASCLGIIFVQNSLACSCELLYQCKFPPSTFSSFSPSLYSSLIETISGILATPPAQTPCICLKLVASWKFGNRRDISADS
ncbi:hypothetical protein LMH87_010198 [Akanthomyces muscarius]|uniref:Secreted protein n=1 Tax=Akanthomyces muscarius TaxID=2231603 RepID=A0A9W8QG66_AKAMU|nr:hypothetical protein LMH87_010198 [Akanthomyces muscarius]KAJ4153724.1 hypothetical protein LMH87_010198 [Akanthomyces muscarius]